jgi:hypothetical protein
VLGANVAAQDGSSPPGASPSYPPTASPAGLESRLITGGSLLDLPGGQLRGT